MRSDRKRRLRGVGDPKPRLRVGAVIVIASISAVVLSQPLWWKEISEEAAGESMGIALPELPDEAFLPAAARRMIEGAIDECRRTPTSDGFITLGLMYHGNGLTAPARKCYESALQLGAVNAQTPYLLGLILLEEGRYEEAAERFRASISLREDYPLAHHHLGRSLLHANSSHPHEAIASMSRAVELDPQDTMMFTGLGKALRFAKRLDEAEDSLRHALRLDPQNAKASHLLGLTLQERGATEEAAAHLSQRRTYNASVYNDPWLGQAYRYTASVDVRISRARDLIRFGRSASAVADLSALAATHPEHPRVLRTLGEAYAAGGDHQRAFDAFSRAAKLSPDDAGVRSAMAQILLTHGMLEDADGMAQRALEIDPAMLDAAAVRGVVALRQGRTQNAVTLLEAVLERRPDHANAMLFLGEALIALELHERAVEVLRRARTFSELDEGYVNLQLGIALARAGALVEAEDALIAAASTRPHDETVQAELAAVRAAHLK